MVEPKYAVLYVRDARTNAGFVYLPGCGEDGEAIARALVRGRADQGAFGSKLSATPLMQ